LQVLRLHPQSGDQVEATLPPSSFCRVPRAVRGTMLTDEVLHAEAAGPGERALITLAALRDAGYRVRVIRPALTTADSTGCWPTRISGSTQGATLRSG
jgi:hypothetical protein